MNSQGRQRMKVGIIGAGWVAANRHAPAVQRSKVGRIAAVCDHSREKALAIAPRGVPVFTDPEDLLASDLDAVVICTPPHSHAALATASIRSGRHTLVEKPFALTSAEGRQVDEAGKAAGVSVAAGHNFLFSRSAMAAQAEIASGAVGEPVWALGLQTSSWRRRLPVWRDSLPGGLFFDEAPHLLYLMRRFLGHLSVSDSRITDFSPGGQSQLVDARLGGAAGTARLLMWAGAPHSEWILALYCSRATLVIDLFRDILIKLPAERSHGIRDVMTASWSATFQHWGGTLSTGVRSLAGRQDYGADRLMKSFLTSAGSGCAPLVSAEDGWRVVELIEQIRDAARQ
jgi:predicted dehydrogenase